MARPRRPAFESRVARFGPSVRSDEDVQGAIAVLAQLHGRWWDASGTGITLGTPHTEASLRNMVHEIRSHLPVFLGELGEDLPRADALVLETVFNSSLAPWLRLVEPRDLTVIHGDAHTWNFLFPRSGGGTPYLIDWQTWHRDVGARDLAYLMALHWDPDTRQRLELPLLQLYHQELIRVASEAIRLPTSCLTIVVASCGTARSPSFSGRAASHAKPGGIDSTVPSRRTATSTPQNFCKNSGVRGYTIVSRSTSHHDLATGHRIRGAAPRWDSIVDPESAPTLKIEDDGTPANTVRAHHGRRRLSNDHIAVANRGTNDIRIFDARARHVVTFGRSGEGPGEFRRLEMIGRSGDTAWFYDSGLQRMTAVLLGAKPELSGTTRVTATGKRESFSVTGRLPDGRYVVTTNVSPTFDGPPGVHRLPGSTGIIARTGDGEVAWLGDFRSAAIFVHNPTGDFKQAGVGPIAFPRGSGARPGEDRSGLAIPAAIRSSSFERVTCRVLSCAFHSRRAHRTRHSSMPRATRKRRGTGRPRARHSSMRSTARSTCRNDFHLSNHCCQVRRVSSGSRSTPQPGASHAIRSDRCDGSPEGPGFGGWRQSGTGGGARLCHPRSRRPGWRRKCSPASSRPPLNRELTTADGSRSIAPRRFRSNPVAAAGPPTREPWR